jgi:hypothetical protein
MEPSAASPLDIGGDQFGAGRAGKPDHRGEIAALVYRSAEGGYPGTPIYRFVDPGQKEKLRVSYGARKMTSFVRLPLQPSRTVEIGKLKV